MDEQIYQWMDECMTESTDHLLSAKYYSSPVIYRNVQRQFSASTSLLKIDKNKCMICPFVVSAKKIRKSHERNEKVHGKSCY